MQNPAQMNILPAVFGPDPLMDVKAAESVVETEF
jgi:hypothetical protein